MYKSSCNSNYIGIIVATEAVTFTGNIYENTTTRTIYVYDNTTTTTINVCVNTTNPTLTSNDTTVVTL